jgi:acyl-coenzyme A synthetase/AMP-(fatty) acid ligase
MTRPGERVYLRGSPLHIFGLTVGVLLTLRIGATLVFPHRFHPGDLLDRARHARVNVVLGVPAHFDMLSQAAGDDRPDALRLAVSAGDVLTDAVKHRFERRYDVGVGQIYGMSECGAIATDLTGEFTHPVVGRLLPGIEPRITEGELYLRLDRSPYPFAEHSGRYADGWLRTYDRAALDPATAVLTLLGRADAVRIIGGLKVDLTEVEALLREHPKVTEALVVLRTAKDNDSPPMLEAYVAGGDLVADELAAWCRSRLSTFKVPRRWHIGADIPRTALGKPDRRVQEREPR